MDSTFHQRAAAGRRVAERLITRRVPLEPQVARDPAGHPVTGFGRSLHHFPLSEQDGAFLLRSQLVVADRELAGRLFELTSTQQGITDEQIGVLLVLATLIGPRPMRDWAPLWDALRQAEWARAGMEVMRCNLLKLHGDTPQNQLRVAELLTILMSGADPEAS